MQREKPLIGFALIGRAFLVVGGLMSQDPGLRLVSLTRISLSNPDSLRVLDKEGLRGELLKLKNQDLRGAFLLADKLQSFGSDVLKVLKDVAFSKAKSYERNIDGSYEIPFPHGNGRIVFKPRVNSVLKENIAYDLLMRKGILDECRHVSFDMDKIKAYKKANVITDEEYEMMFATGEPVYNLSFE